MVALRPEIFGIIGYVVTFDVEVAVVARETDPVITDDVSDPLNPDIVELNEGKADPYVIDVLTALIVNAVGVIDQGIVLVPKI